MFIRKTSYTFPLIPLKKCEAQQSVKVDVPSNVMKQIQKSRLSCVGIMEKARNVLEKKKDINSVLETEKSREKFIEDILTCVDAYAFEIISVVSANQSVATCHYYTWSSSLFDPQNIGYDDYRYDLMGFYFNAATALYDVAQYLLCMRANTGTLAALEKEAYRTLLKASGYFGLCEELAVVIKEKPLGQARVPFPMDSAQTMHKLLADVCICIAQEIGVYKAFDADTNGKSDTTVRLAHQLVKLYDASKSTASGITSRNPSFLMLTTLLTVKRDVYDALCSNFAAVWAFQHKPANGMYFLGEAKKKMKLVEEYSQMVKKGKLQLPAGGAELLQDSIVDIKRNDERLSKVNAMVHRATPEKADLPPPQVLAMKANAKLPSELPQ